MKLILIAIPFFFLLIGIELAVGLWRRKNVYRLNDSINDLSMGILQQVVGVFSAAVVIAGYLFVYENFRLGNWAADSVWTWVAGFLLYDLMYYWAHRAGHRVNFLWASHIPHHQSEEYNLTVALRQGAFQSWCFSAFYLPPALVGIPPAVFLVCAAIDTIYQFWIHTRLIGKLGPLEWVLNTPSHHRVHHAKDEKYIDKNYGGTLIIWDRIFGTFEAETDEPTYGTVKPLRSWNPLWAMFHHWVYMAKVAWRTPRWRDKFKIWFAEPAWAPADCPAPEVASEADFKAKYDPQLPLGLNIYVLVQFVPAIAVTLFFLLNFALLATAMKVAMALFVVLSLVCIGGILDGRRWAYMAEFARLALSAALGIALASTHFEIAGHAIYAVSAALAAAMGACGVWLWRYRGTVPATSPASAPAQPTGAA